MKNLDQVHRNKTAARLLLGAILSATCLSASAASFDCAKARSKSERLICSDPRLSAMDDRLAALAAAGKKRAASPRAYQRMLDAAWSVRQKCDDIACVESWYAERIAALSVDQAEAIAANGGALAKEQAAAPVISTRPEVAVRPPAPVAAAPLPKPEMTRPAAPAPRAEASQNPVPAKRAPVAPVVNAPSTPNVSPGAQLQVIGGELGFHIPLTREEFLDRYKASGGQCGVSGQLSSLKALARSADSDCWTGTECRSPAAGLSCKMLRTAFDSTGRIVLFTTTLATADGSNGQGSRDMGKVLEKFAEFGGSEIRTKEVKDGSLVSAIGSQGQFKLEAEVKEVDGGQQVGTFSLATK